MKHIIICQINIDSLKVSGKESYINGEFIPIFSDILKALAKEKINAATLRVLLYILAIADKNNCVLIDVDDIASHTDLGYTAIYGAIGGLIKMNILGQQESRKKRKKKGRYILNLYVLNPQIGYRGNTRKINKHLAPAILKKDGISPLIEMQNFRNTEYLNSFQDDED